MSRNYFYGCPNVDFEDVCGNPGECNELGRCKAFDEDQSPSRARAREAMGHKARKVKP